VAAKDRTQAAIKTWIKDLPKYLYQKEVVFRLRSRDFWDT
jgi:hypothetical protein